MKAHCAPLLAALIASPAFATTADFEEVLTMRVDGELVVDANGKVAAHTIHTAVPDEYRAIVARAARDWTFNPPLAMEGNVASARGPMRITMSAAQNGDGFAVAIDNVSFPQTASGTANKSRASSNGVLRATKQPLPKYPDVPAHGVVMVDARVSPDGIVRDAVATQCSVHSVAREHVRERARVCDAMALNAVHAIKRWTFAYEPGAAPARGDHHITLPVEYLPTRRSNKDTTGQWRREWRTAYAPAPWRSTGSERVGTASVWETSTVVANSELGLHAGVPDHVLHDPPLIGR